MEGLYSHINHGCGSSSVISNTVWYSDFRKTCEEKENFRMITFTLRHFSVTKSLLNIKIEESMDPRLVQVILLAVAVIGVYLPYCDFELVSLEGFSNLMNAGNHSRSRYVDAMTPESNLTFWETVIMIIAGFLATIVWGL